MVPVIPSVSSLPAKGATEAHRATACHSILPEDQFTLAGLSEVSISPHGSMVAYLESHWVDKERQHHLRVVDAAGGTSRRLTQGPDGCLALRWSPDERNLYFASTRDGDGDARGLQVWRIRPEGGAPEQATRVPGGISRYGVGTSTGAIYYSRDIEAPPDEWRRLGEEFRDAVEPPRPVKLRSAIHRLDPDTGKTTLILEHDRYVSCFTVSPDESRIALVSAPDQRLISNEGESSLELLDIDSGATHRLADRLWREDAPSPHGWIETPAWSPDGSRLAFRVAHDAFPPEIIVADLSSATPRLSHLPRPLECHPLRVGWQSDSRHLVFNASHRAAIVLVSVDTESPSSFRFLAEGDVVVEAFSIGGGSDDMAILQSSPDSLPEVHLLRASGQSKRLTHVHAHTAGWAFPSLSRFTWSGRDGTPLEGTLELPAGYEPDNGRLPLLVILHGGPTAAAEMGRLFGIRGHTAFAAKGYAVFSPNYRGSTGYGDEFLTALVGDTNRIEIDDILSGVDALVEEGIGDPDRLGMMGWSYGGYLVNCLLATNRFKAASSGAGTVDMTLQFGDMDTPGHTLNLLGGSHPWEAPGEYRRVSPIFGLRHGIKTATLVHSGSQDRRVPVAQARILHRVLHRYLGARCELVVYQGAGHRLERYEHELACLTLDHAWFAKYLA